MRGERHLTRPQQYALVYSRGGSWASESVVMKALPNGLPLSRHGLSVSKRVGNAVTRNKVKRRLREIMRQAPVKPGWDMVFIARPAAARADYAGLKAAVEKLLVRARLLVVDRGPGPEAEVTAGSTTARGPIDEGT